MAPPPGVAAFSQPPHMNGHPVNPSQVQLPPNIDFNAPVIRMGGAPVGGRGPRTGGFDAGPRESGNRGRAGLGADSGRTQREPNLQPLTKEEVSRSVFVGGLDDGAPSDAALEEILNAGRGLRRWTRAFDPEGKPCNYGFAEYEDADSLEIAAKLFEDFSVPIKKDSQIEKDEGGQVKTMKLTTFVDPQSEEYIQKWSKGNEDELHFKMDGAQEDLRSVIAAYIDKVNKGEEFANDTELDGPIDYAAQAKESAELLNLPTATEDELAIIPADMRELIAGEIALFRERSKKRDEDRLRMEEDVERTERDRYRASRPNRLATPPPSAPKGPAAGPNGAPSGPRDRQRGWNKAKDTGPHIPKDYIDGAERADADDSADDEELEQRRRNRRQEELERSYLEQEKRWLAKEKNHAAAVERQQREENQENEARDRKRAELVEILSSFDDDAEGAQRKKHLFFTDRKEWRMQRRVHRQHERHSDDSDRRAEEREEHARRRRADQARSAASRPSEYSGDEGRAARPAPAEKQGFSLNLGGLRARATGIKTEDQEEQEQRAKRALADMENLLDDDNDSEEEAESKRNLLKPLDLKPLAPGEKMTDEQRAQASNELAKSIPNDAESLYKWKIQWEHLPNKMIAEQLRPYIERKVMEALGVQEDLMVASIEAIIKCHGTAEEVVAELEETLDEEADMVTRRIWKMVVFYSEANALGLVDEDM